MLIEMLALAASPDGHMYPGKVYDVPRKQAEALLKGGPDGRPYARKVSGKPETVSEPAKAKSPDTEGEDE
jgi:hypothetical protein